MHKQTFCQKLFDNSLNQIIPTNTKVTLITDAGFRTQWFRQVIEYGWDVIGRIYDGFSYQKEGEKGWHSLKEVDFGGTSKARSLGKIKLITRYDPGHNDRLIFRSS